MEALVRWEHPTMGLVPPNRFISIAEDTGTIIELDRIVMNKAISQFSKWKDDGIKVGKLSINLATKQLQENDLIEFINKLLMDNNCKAEDIELEITESCIMNNPKQSINMLNTISNLGISLAVDDFGTGYSSLAYLKKLPIDKLKIDKSFIDELPFDLEDVAISKTIIDLSKNLNLKIIAEGVENEVQKDFLIKNGCNDIQGYLFSRPLAANDMQIFLKNYAITAI